MRLPEHIKKSIRTNVCMKQYCTLGIGGHAKYFYEMRDEKELLSVLNWCLSVGLDYFVLGMGSNILFSDDGFDGLVIRVGENYSSIIVEDRRMLVEAGAWMPYIALTAYRAGLSGIEHTVGIPGRMGGIVMMNAGSLRKSISSNLHTIKYIDEELKIVKEVVRKDDFSYRKSPFSGRRVIILSVELELSKKAKFIMRTEMLNILRDRRNKFPRKTKNCGSVFKSNPALYDEFGPPGKIIEGLGLKGAKKGEISISDFHANFFINSNAGKSKDFDELISLVNHSCQENLGITLEPEVVRVGSFKK